MQEKRTLQIDQLCFSFRRQPLLFNNLDLTIKQGTTFGILGPNGAGKSTLIKIITGLIPLAKGSVEIFGKHLSQNRQEILQQVGYLIEVPRLYPHLSGMDNLRVFATYRHLSLLKLPALLDEVGLNLHANKLVRHYSTGMKQRLAIAIAIMHDPALLIFDEPTNGLDPQGIAEIRELILELKNKRERTIIFCSHILSEVQQVCDEVGILHGGQFVFNGLTKNLNQGSVFYLLETNDPIHAAQILRTRKEWNIENKNQQLIISLNNPDEVNHIIDLLRKSEIRIFQIKRIEDHLESTYLQYVKK